MQEQEARVALDEIIGIGILSERFDYRDCLAFFECRQPTQEVRDELRGYFLAKEMFFSLVKEFPKELSHLDCLLGMYLSRIKTTKEAIERAGNTDHDLYYTLSAERSLLLRFEQRIESIATSLGAYQSSMHRKYFFAQEDALSLVGSKYKQIHDMLKASAEE